MKNLKKGRSRAESACIAAAIIMTIAVTFYWLAVINHAYFTFKDGGQDLSVFAYNFYFNTHYSAIASGLQFIVLGNHLSPDGLILLLAYYLFPYTISLLYIQTIAICLCALLVFFISKRLIGNPVVALALSSAFLLNPGIMGVLTFDFHLEFLIIPTYLLMFYSYMASNKWLFAISLMLLLGSLEVAPLVALSLGIGLLAYEISRSNYKWNGIEKGKREMIIAIIIVSLIAGMLYYIGMIYLQSSYIASYSQLPGMLKITSGSQFGLLSNIKSLVSNPAAFLAKNLSPFKFPLGIYILVLSAILTFFGFGFFTMKKPLVTLLLLLPWFVLVLTWSGNAHFVYTGFQYYAITVGATIAAEIIGIISLQGKDASAKNGKKSIRLAPLISINIIMVIMLFASLFVAQTPAIYASIQKNPYDVNQTYSMIGLVPANASLMASWDVFPHVAKRENIEFTESLINYGYFVPQYIIVNSSNSTIRSSGVYDALNYTISNYTYGLYASSGDVRLYKLAGPR